MSVIYSNPGVLSLFPIGGGDNYRQLDGCVGLGSDYFVEDYDFDCRTDGDVLTVQCDANNWSDPNTRGPFTLVFKDNKLLELYPEKTGGLFVQNFGSAAYFKNWAHYYVQMKRQNDGIHTVIRVGDLKYETVITEEKELPVTVKIGGKVDIKNIIVTSDDTPCYSMDSPVINDVSGWSKTEDGSAYVVTAVNKDGTIIVDNETLSKILQTHGILSCAIIAHTTRKGDALKKLQFTVDGKTNTVDIPQGESSVYIPISFDSPSDLDNMKLTVKGD